MTVLERRHLRLGFIPLNDCAPLVVARELGLFAEEGLDVTLSREASWANIRDKVAVGLLDGAHMLAPLPLATGAGAGGDLPPMVVPLALNLNGSAVTIAAHHAAAMRSLDPEAMALRPLTARPLAQLVRRRAEQGERPLVFAVVFPFSMHNYELRYWLAEGGIDPDCDVRLVVAPPTRMVARLESGEIDGFCVGAPWNTLAVSRGVGEVLIHAGDFWRLGPDKALGVTAAWAERHPRTLRALLRALLRAGLWADDPRNRAQLAAMLAGADYLDAAEDVVGASLADPATDDLVFHRHAAAYPWRSHALWFLSQMMRWGQIGPDLDLPAIAAGVYRPDIFRNAAADLGIAAPVVDEKVEGAHGGPWLLEEATDPIPMGPDRFFDGRLFDAVQAAAYARAFPIGRLASARDFAAAPRN
jgi:ABC-type nitrate/sulfonate/bicarbonate transport system substrate-binding protein